MLSNRIPTIRSQTLVGTSLFFLGLCLAYEIGGKIAAGDLNSLAFITLGFIVCAVAVTILRNWRAGFYSFLTWLLFEDLARKYMGNSTALFFGKDVLAFLTYLSLFAAVRAGREKAFRPKFLLFLAIFVWLGLMQIFNAHSPHVLYGILGFKVYFFYVPMMYVGYALVRTDEDLRKFLVLNAVLAGIIAALGVAQAIMGHSFLNPSNLAPELRELGELDKYSPLTNQILSLPTAVFVSSGRFANYLIIAIILVLGASGYLLLYTRRSRKLILAVTAIVGAAILFSGSRGAVMYGAISALVMSVGFLWGAPWKARQARHMGKAIRRSFIGVALGLATIILLFPAEVGSRLAFYGETLLPNSSAYELTHRGWEYPIQNLTLAFTNPNWVLGNGIGTASLGSQYVSKLLGQPPFSLWVEEGYGQLIIEMGIVAPFLWIAWTAALLYSMWQVLRVLRETRFFPIGFAIFWYAFLLLYPFTYGGLSPYQNYVDNAYFWLLIGVFFALQGVLAAAPSVPALANPVRTRTRMDLSSV
jgi:hypothetical protein